MESLITFVDRESFDRTSLSITRYTTKRNMIEKQRLFLIIVNYFLLVLLIFTPCKNIPVVVDWLLHLAFKISFLFFLFFFCTWTCFFQLLIVEKYIYTFYVHFHTFLYNFIFCFSSFKLGFFFFIHKYVIIQFFF
jgi:hypothetical protein